MPEPITIELIKDLRARTGLGLADCKRALEATAGNLLHAYLRLLSEGKVADTRGMPHARSIDRSFPRCTVKGARDPVPYAHLVLRGCIPRKCAACDSLFEGSCVRTDFVYMDLDHGPCPFDGPTPPVDVETPRGPDRIPAKCRDCAHREDDSIRGTTCRFGKDSWGDFERSFDWGDWNPPDES